MELIEVTTAKQKCEFLMLPVRLYRDNPYWIRPLDIIKMNPLHFLSLPERNQIFKHVNGKLDWTGKIKYVWHTLMRTNKKVYSILFGVVPAHQGKGVDGALIEACRYIAKKDNLVYRDFEMNWIGDFNTKMIRVTQQVNAVVVKRHATYRKLFDESRPFKRMPILG